jgi:predicted amidohydrolase
MEPVFANTKANIEKTIEFALKAKSEEASIIVFPELSLTGYSLQDLTLQLSMKLDSTLLEPILNLSKDIAIVTSFPRLCEDGITRISSVFFDEGKIVSVYDKICLPTHGMFDEMRYFGRGEKLQSFQTRFGKIGLLVCRDIWHPELAYVYSAQNAQMVIVSSAIPARNLTDNGFGVAASLEITIANTAFCNQFFVVMCNRVGIEDGVTFLGNSRVCSPTGKTMLELPEFKESLDYAQIDFCELSVSRAKTSLVRERRNDIVLRELGKLEE